MSSYSPLQVALLALLPKSGEGVQVAELARSAGVSEEAVVDALLAPYSRADCNYSRETRTYHAVKSGDALPRR